MSASLPTIHVADADVEIVEYRGERVVTFKQIDRVHKRPKDTAKRNFDENRPRFAVGEDFIEVGRDEIRTNLVGAFSKFAPKGTLLTRRGYYKLVKSLNDDRAWAIHAEMVDAYFAVLAGPAAPAQIPTTAEAFANAFLMIAENEKRQAANERALIEIGSKVERIEQAQTVMSSCPANAESITHLRKRIGAMFGISAETIDAVLRQSPYAPKPAGTVRNGHEDAEGSTYVVYWKKDVTAVFDRFASECTRVTPTMATHPFVDCRFKMTGKSSSIAA